jgi:hypothetical protein
VISDSAQAFAGFIQVIVLFGEAEAQEVFAATGAEERAAGHRCNACGGE